MANFFFWLDECGTITDPMECVDLPDLASALAYATKEARILMCEELRSGRLCLSCKIDIADEAGRHLGTVHYRDAVVISGMPSASA